MSQVSERTALDTVQQFHDAWTSGDVDRAMQFTSDDFVCQAPGGEIRGKASYSEFLAAFTPMLTGVPHIATFADGDRVALFYYPQTEIAQSTVAGECFTVRDGLITESVLAFDRLSYGPPDAD